MNIGNAAVTSRSLPGLHRVRQRTFKEDTNKTLFAHGIEKAVTSCMIWIEECTGVDSGKKTLLEYLADGVVLCELMQQISPGIIKRINRLKSPFAYWENVSFFLEACKKLELQDSQLFNSQDLLGTKTRSEKDLSHLKNQDSARVKKVVATLYWLGRTVDRLPGYKGAHLDFSAFSQAGNILLPHTSRHTSERLENDSLSSHSPSSTPEHKLISTYSPSAIKRTGYTSTHSLNRTETESPQLWVQRLTSSKPGSLSQPEVAESFEESERTGSAQDQYHFGHPSSCSSHGSDELDSQSSEVSTVITAGNRSRSHSLLELDPIRIIGQQSTSVKVESHPAPEPFSSNLVFIHGNSTSSSVLSPTNHLQGYASVARNHPYSPNHLSNSFGGTETIDSTGLYPLHSELGSLDFVNSVFTASDSQDSVHFSPRDSEATTFHVNLTQTSQPDPVSAGNTQPDDFVEGEYGRQQELPTISEIANSSPIDTFNLHRCRATTDSSLTLTDRPDIAYSNSQDFSDHRTIPQLTYAVGEIREVKNLETSVSLVSQESVQQQVNFRSSSKGNTSPITSNSHTGRSSAILVSYIPCAASPTRERIPPIHSSEKTHERPSNKNPSPLAQPQQPQPPRKYSASKPRKEPSPPRKPFPRLQTGQSSLSDTEMESEIALQISQDLHTSGKRQIFVPAQGLDERSGEEVTSTSTVNNKSSPATNGNIPHAGEGKEITLILFPKNKQLGFQLEQGRKEGDAPVISTVDADSPAARSGIRPGDRLLVVDDCHLEEMTEADVSDILQELSALDKVYVTVRRSITTPLHSWTGRLVNNNQHHLSHSEQHLADEALDNVPSPVVTRITNLEPEQNGYGPEESESRQKMQDFLLGTFDLQRVQRVESGALLQPSKAVYMTSTKSGSQEELKPVDPPSDIFTDISTNAVEFGSSVDTDSHRSASDVGVGEIGSRTELNRSPSLPSVDEVLEPVTTPKHIAESKQKKSQDDDFFPDSGDVMAMPSSSLSPPPASESWNTNGSAENIHSQFRSLSATQLPSSTVDDGDNSQLVEKVRARRLAKKTGSLPGKFSRPSNRLREERCKSSSPAVGMNLQNMSLEDVQSASKLQIDEIWREVETSTALSSPRSIDPSNQLFSQEKLVSEEDLGTTSTTGLWEERGNEQAVGSTRLEPGRSPIRQFTPEYSPGPLSDSSLVISPPSKSSTAKGIDTLLTTLRSLNEKVGTYDEEEEFKMLEELLQSSRFQKAKSFHDKMRGLVERSEGSPPPEVQRILPATRHVRHLLRENVPRSAQTKELRRLLRKPHVQGALFVHDKVATRDFYIPSTFFPKSSQDPEDIILSHSVVDLYATSLYVSQEAPLSRDVPSSRKENATIVYLQRTNRPLGCTIYKQADAVFVGKLLKGCDADQSGVLREGDELLEINGIALMGKSTDEIIRIMSGEAGKVLAFTLIPVHDDSAGVEYEETYVRAHFSYNGYLDEEVPCKELSLNFTKGDILEVSNQDDPDWWQARKVFDDGGESLPGLIPARHLQQKREVLRESFAVSYAQEEKNKKKGLLSKLARKKKKKIYYNQGLFGAQAVGHEVVTYEDVIKLMPDANRRRPIVLIGAPCIGRTTLAKKLNESDPRHYSTCIQHTSRPIKSGERDGRDFYFLTREEMERGIQSGKFLEYMEVRGHLCGLAISSVRRAIEFGRVPVLDLHPPALKVLGSSGLMPYVIFISSPRVDRLEMTRKVGYDKQKKKIHSSVSVDAIDRDVHHFTETELVELYYKSQEIQAEYSHYFDWVIVNDDLQVATDMLIEVARRIEEEPQWVPASWAEDV